MATYEELIMQATSMRDQITQVERDCQAAILAAGDDHELRHDAYVSHAAKARALVEQLAQVQMPLSDIYNNIARQTAYNQQRGADGSNWGRHWTQEAEGEHEAAIREQMDARRKARQFNG
jgi:hypothetical protein